MSALRIDDISSLNSSTWDASISPLKFKTKICFLDIFSFFLFLFSFFIFFPKAFLSLADKIESFKSSAVLAYLVERFLTRNPPEEEPELDFMELIIINIGITIATAIVSAFNKKIKYSNKISIIYIKKLTIVPVRQEASVAAKRALKAIFNNVPLMSGHIAERPPKRMPTLDILAKPQIP